MAKRTLITKNSALGENSKTASLTQEVVRRSKNTREEVSIEARVQTLDKFHKRLELSQYNLKAISRIIVADQRIKGKAAKISGNINRSEEEGAEGRYKKKLLSKAN